MQDVQRLGEVEQWRQGEVQDWQIEVVGDWVWVWGHWEMHRDLEESV